MRYNFGRRSELIGARERAHGNDTIGQDCMNGTPPTSLMRRRVRRCDRLHGGRVCPTHFLHLVLCTVDILSDYMRAHVHRVNIIHATLCWINAEPVLQVYVNTQVNLIYKRAQWSAKPNLRRKRRMVKWIGRPAGSSGSWGDDERYQEWYRYGEIEGEHCRF